MKITRIAWNPHAETAFQKVFVEPNIMDEVRRDVMVGVSMLWKCESALNCGYCITRDEPGELVIVGCVGSGVMEFGPQFLRAAAKKGATVRTHVNVPKLVDYYKRLGFVEGNEKSARADETVLRWAHGA